jgi:hypothetical protein
VECDEVVVVWGKAAIANSKVDLYVRCSEHQVRRPQPTYINNLAAIHACHATPCPCHAWHKPPARDQTKGVPIASIELIDSPNRTKQAAQLTSSSRRCEDWGFASACSKR